MGLDTTPLGQLDPSSRWPLKSLCPPCLHMASCPPPPPRQGVTAKASTEHSNSSAMTAFQQTALLTFDVEKLLDVSPGCR